MSDLFAALLALWLLLVPVVIPVLLTILIILAILKKPVKKLVIGKVIYIGSILPIAILFVLLSILTDPATWCDHEYEIIKEIPPTYSEEGEIHRHCPLCDDEDIDYIDKLKPDGDDTVSNTSNDGYINGEKVDGEISDIKTDNIVEKLRSIGFTESEAQEIREIFLLCGVTSIDGAKPTDPNATIDGLVAYRWVIDDDRTLLFTVENRELFYIALNGVDVYDTDKGGFLININDVHIPESEISKSVKNTLKDLTERTLDGYFTNAIYYDAWGMGRQDDDYMVQCEVYATNKLGVSNWIKAKVWFKYDGENYNVTGVVIDGVRYK